MTIHYCFRCGYSSKKKGTWKRHLHKKKICSVKHLDLPRDEICNNYHTYLDCFMSILNSDSDHYECSNCDFNTKYKQNLKRHIIAKTCIDNKNEIINQLQYSVKKLKDSVKKQSEDIETLQLGSSFTPVKSNSIIEPKHKKKRRIPIHPLKRTEFIESQDYKCGICDHQIIGTNYHIDHLIPVSCGGTNIDMNLLCVCPNCHGLKTKFVDPISRHLCKSSVDGFCRIRFIGLIRTIIDNVCNIDQYKSEDSKIPFTKVTAIKQSNIEPEPPVVTEPINSIN